MVHRIAAIPTTLAGIQGNLTIASQFKLDFSYSYGAVDQISLELLILTGAFITNWSKNVDASQHLSILS